MHALVLRQPRLRAILVRSDRDALEAALGGLIADVSRGPVLDRMRAVGIAETQAHLDLLRAASPEVGPDPDAWIALEIHTDQGSAIPLWSVDAPPADIIKWLTGQAPDAARAKSYGALIREIFAEIFAEIRREDEFIVSIALIVRAWLAWNAIEEDRKRAFIAIDAGSANHRLVSGWRNLPKDRRPRKVAVREGKAELIGPDNKTAVSLNVQELPERIIHAVREWQGWQGLRHWAGLQLLFTKAGRTGRVRWALESHLDALGYIDRSRRDPKVRATVASEVEALTRMEVAVYNDDGTLRVRGPLLAVIQRGEAQVTDSEWALEGMELVVHPVLYEGVRQEDGSLGKHWAPAPAELASIHHGQFPHAIVLGLILPIRWRWDAKDEREYLTLTGKTLLETAGIEPCPHNPSRPWETLDRNLAELQRVGGLGRWEWENGEKHTRAGRCRLYPPQWIRDRLVHGITPIEAPPPARIPRTGAELLQWRKDRGWTQAQAARELGVGERTIRVAEATPEAPLGRSLQTGLENYKPSYKKENNDK